MHWFSIQKSVRILCDEWLLETGGGGVCVCVFVRRGGAKNTKY